MRILHVVPSFGFGGMEKIICAVIDGTNSNHQHLVMALDGRTPAVQWIKHTDVQIISFVKCESKFYFFKELFSALRAAQPDVLMTYNWGATDGIWLGRLVGISKIVHHEHGFNVEESTSTARIRDLIRFIVYRLTSRVVVVSHELEDMLLRKFRAPETLVTRISNGVDISFYSPNELERQRVRAFLGYKSSEVVIGFSGRLDPIKNLNMLVDIFEASKPRDYPFRLLIVGDGPDRSRLERRCQSAGIQSYVKFVGPQAEVLPYLRAMDAFLLTSLREQMPLTVLEAMSVGIPVVATRVGEIPYMIDDGVDGFIRDLDAPILVFVQLLRSFLCASERRRLADAARCKVLKKFNQDRMLQNYTRLIAEFQ
jgi:L-malate glycosyltransferase